MNTKTFLDERARFIETVRQYVASQKKLWRQVPWLALQSDGRSGYSEHLKRAYRDSHWPLFKLHTSEHIACVELETGRLLNWNGSKVLDDAWLTVIASDPAQIDASAVVARLKTDMRCRHATYYNPDEQRAWRREGIKLYGLRRNAP